MPQWIHARAEHILAKNPSMPKSEAFALATQQSHAVGKSPKGYGTAEGRATAQQKYDTPKDDEKKANPGHLESPKMAAAIEVGKKRLPISNDHMLGMKVPGGSNCGNCHFGEMQEDGPHCKNGFWVAAPREVGGGGGATRLPVDDPKNFCCDEWKPVNEKKAGLASQAVVGGLAGGLLGHTEGKIRGSDDTTAETLAGAALGAVGVPALRHLGKKLDARQLRHMEGRIAKQNFERARPDASGLRKHLDPGIKSRVKEAFHAAFSDELQKMAFEVSQYSGPLSYGPFPQVSHLPPFKVPTLAKAVEKPEQKIASGATTPAGQLASAKKVGLPKVTAPSGPSISDIAKPHGFGTPAAGATKTF